MNKKTSKRLRIIILIYAIFLILSGLFHIIKPQTAELESRAIERIFGSSMLAFALGAVFAYKNIIWKRIKIAVMMLLTWQILYTITMAWGVLAGGLPTASWSAVITGAV